MPRAAKKNGAPSAAISAALTAPSPADAALPNAISSVPAQPMSQVAIASRPAHSGPALHARTPAFQKIARNVLRAETIAKVTPTPGAAKIEDDPQETARSSKATDLRASAPGLPGETSVVLPQRKPAAPDLVAALRIVLPARVDSARGPKKCGRNPSTTSAQLPAQTSLDPKRDSIFIP